MHPLHRAALDADEAFQAALVKAYGTRAADARYWSVHTDADVRYAKVRKQAADEAWHKTIQGEK